MDKRHYSHSDHPAVVENVDSVTCEEQRQILFKLYSEVCTSYRSLHDVRFKLLSLVPFVTVAVLVVILPGTGSGTSLLGPPGTGVCLVGFFVSIGLLIYELRNSSLYDDLISRGRRIEAELGIHTGVFRGRRKPKWPLVNHGTAIFLIYGAAILGWIMALWYTSGWMVKWLCE